MWGLWGAGEEVEQGGEWAGGGRAAPRAGQPREGGEIRIWPLGEIFIPVPGL